MRLFHYIPQSHNHKRGVLASATLATIAGTIGTAALIGGGTVGAMSLAEQAKKGIKKEVAPAVKPLPKVPKPEDAKAKAETEVARRRRIIALAGGRTILTTEAPLGVSGQKTLLGQ